MHGETVKFEKSTMLLSQTEHRRLYNAAHALCRLGT